MEPNQEQQNIQEVSEVRTEGFTTRHQELFCITPLSKYLAITLMLILPFLGGYVGYMYAIEKIVEDPAPVYTESSQKVEIDTELNLNNVVENAIKKVETDSALAQSDYSVYAFRDNDGWNGAWLMKKNLTTGMYEKYVQVSDGFTEFSGIVDKNFIYLNSYSTIYKIDLLSSSVTKLNIGEGLVDFLVDGDDVLGLVNSTPLCLDVPSSRTACTSSLYKISVDGNKQLIASEMPGSKNLIAFNKDSREVVLGDGYGDGGCISNFYTRYTITSQTSELEFRDGYCSNDDSTYEEYQEKVTDYLDGLNGLKLVKNDTFTDFKITNGVVTDGLNVVSESKRRGEDAFVIELVSTD